MEKSGLLIDYEFCTGCHSCEVACKQEHGYPAGKWGIKVTEFIQQISEKKMEISYLPFPTDLCNLCHQRTSQGEQPACVKHCQAACMTFGTLGDLVSMMTKKPKMVLYSPK